MPGLEVDAEGLEVAFTSTIGLVDRLLNGGGFRSNFNDVLAALPAFTHFIIFTFRRPRVS